jgi:hypothetical protein
MASINPKGGPNPSFVSPYLLRPRRSLAEVEAGKEGGARPWEPPEDEVALRLALASKASDTSGGNQP